MNIPDFEQIKQLLDSPKSIGIIAHRNADGDAIGSSLAMYHYLKAKNHEVQIIVPDAFPDFLKWMPGSEHIIQYDRNPRKVKKIITGFDIVFLMDFNELSRTGKKLEKVLSGYQGIFVMIDHHEQPSDVARYLFSNPSVCATAQMVYHFLEHLGETHLITPEIATCLYAGIMTDTGSFRFSNTKAETFRIAADLIDAGADNARIYSNVYDVNSHERLLLLAKALQNMVVLPDYRTAYISITEQDKEGLELKKGDTEGFVNYALSLKGIVFGVIFIEDPEQGIIKISFRSKGRFSVNRFARKHFNGGGHNNAAGGRSETSMDKTIEKFRSLLPEYQSELQESYEE